MLMDVINKILPPEVVLLLLKGLPPRPNKY
jgi:hypothetical protein